MTPRRPFAAAHPFATAAMPRPVLKVMIASPSGPAPQAPALALIRKGRARRVREVGDAVSGRRSRGPSRLPVGSHQHRLVVGLNRNGLGRVNRVHGRTQRAGDGTRSVGRSTDGLITRVVLTALVFTSRFGTGIAIARASGGSSSGAAR